MKNDTLQASAGWLLLLILGGFFISGLVLVKDYGMNPDSQKNFLEGKMNLDYVLGGQVDQNLLRWQTHGALIFMLSDAAKRLLSDRLHLYDPIAARHVILPLLTSLFMVPLFLFIKRRWDAAQGLIVVGILLTFPLFWAHTFNNIKDVPLLIFFSLAIMSFVEWDISGTIGYLYGFFFFWGCALAIKLYAFLVPVVLVAWITLRPKDTGYARRASSRKTLLPHLVAGLLISSAIALLFYAPAFWGVKDKLSFLAFWREQAKSMVLAQRRPLNIFSLSQIFFRTPAVMLFLSMAGIFTAFQHHRRQPLYALLLVWFLVPVLIPCLPHSMSYQDIRNCLVFVVPFSLLALVGVVRIASIAAKMAGIARMTVIGTIALLTIGLNLWGVVTTHPYQAIFFNALAGGLKGAQDKDILNAYDYWLNSYREAGRWISEHGAPDANVVAVYFSDMPAMFNTGLIRDAVARTDLKTFQLPAIPVLEGRIDVPANTYLLLVPFRSMRQQRRLLERSTQFLEVYRIERQGGEVCAIYYKGFDSI